MKAYKYDCELMSISVRNALRNSVLLTPLIVWTKWIVLHRIYFTMSQPCDFYIKYLISIQLLTIALLVMRWIDSIVQTQLHSPQCHNFLSVKIILIRLASRWHDCQWRIDGIPLVTLSAGPLDISSGTNQQLIFFSRYDSHDFILLNCVTWINSGDQSSFCISLPCFIPP